MHQHFANGFFIEEEPKAEARLSRTIRSVIVLLTLILFPVVLAILVWERVRVG